MTDWSGGARTARVRARLSERDLTVLGDLARFRLLTTAQVEQLHVTNGSALTRARRARALMQKLTSLLLVVRLPRRVGGIRAGSAGQVYGLSGLGEAVLGIHGPYGKRRRGIWATKPDHVDHLLGIVGAYVVLVDAARNSNGDVELLTFEPEPVCWRPFAGLAGETLYLKPDGFVRVGVGEFELASFIEWDRDTESLPTIRRKCDHYVRYWRTGAEQGLQGVFPQIVWFVPTERRGDGIQLVLGQLAVEAQALFRVALHTDVEAALTTVPGDGGSA